MFSLLKLPRGLIDLGKPSLLAVGSARRTHDLSTAERIKNSMFNKLDEWMFREIMF